MKKIILIAVIVLMNMIVINNVMAQIFCPGNRFQNGDFEIINGNIDINESDDIDLADGWLAPWKSSGGLADLTSENSNKYGGLPRLSDFLTPNMTRLGLPIPKHRNFSSLWITNSNYLQESSSYREAMYNQLLSQIQKNTGIYKFSFEMSCGISFSPQESVTIGVYGVYNPNKVQRFDPILYLFQPKNIDIWNNAPEVKVVKLGTVTTPPNIDNHWQNENFTFNSNVLPIEGITHILFTSDDIQSTSPYNKKYLNFDNFCMAFTRPDDSCQCSTDQIHNNHYSLINADGSIAKDQSSYDCGTTVYINQGQSLTLFKPNYNCSIADCTPTFTYRVFQETSALPVEITHSEMAFSATSPSINIPEISQIQSSGKIIIYANCGGHICDSCRLKVVINPPPPPADSCKCALKPLKHLTGEVLNADGSVVSGSLGDIKCGNTINLITGQILNLEKPNYHCVSNNNCISTFTYKVMQTNATGVTAITPNEISFTDPLTQIPEVAQIQSTGYVTIYAYCGSHLCDSCILFITKPPPVDSCTCGHWGIPINISGSGITVNGNAVTHYNIENNKTIQLKCNELYQFIGRYDCNATPRNCTTKYGATITNPDGTISTFSLQSGGGFHPTVSGTYTLNYTANCGDRNCETGTVYLQVNCNTTPTCDCGNWKKPVTLKGNIIVNGKTESSSVINSSEKYELKCNGKYVLNAVYQCNTKECVPTYKYAMTKPDGTIENLVLGAGGNQFIPTLNGDYKINYQVFCGDKQCDENTFYFNVKCGTPTTCGCGSWKTPFTMKGNILIDGINKKVVVLDNQLKYSLKCNQIYKFYGDYQCNSTIDCKQNILVLVKQPDQTIIVLDVQNDYQFIPTQNGDYEIGYQVKCGDKICDEKKFYFNVKCTPPPPPPSTCECKATLSIKDIQHSKASENNIDYSNYSGLINFVTSESYDKIELEIVNIEYQYNQDDCYKTIKSYPVLWGSLHAANVRGLSPIYPYGRATLSTLNSNDRIVNWQSPTTLTGNLDIPFNILLPPIPTLSCCSIKKLNICFKVSLTNTKECKTCEFYICTDKKPFNPNDYPAQGKPEQGGN